MYLSVLIPTHDYKCYPLVEALHRQLEQAGVDYEVIVADDGSRDQVSMISNLLINDLPHCRYIRRKENVGRARIRNILAQEAEGEWLLFMDSDAKVVSDDFINNYISAFTDDVDVVVGGLCNPEHLPSEDVTLRYYYEKSAEYQRPAAYRSQYPYQNFATFNFVIRRSVIMNIPFNEQCREYGFEDILMGIDMMRNGKVIKHIDNALMHLGFEKNEVFLTKTETSLRTLHSLGDIMVPHSRIGKVAGRLSDYHLTWLVVLTYRCTKPLLRKNLLGKNPNMKVFAFYKLGYFLS